MSVPLLHPGGQNLSVDADCESFLSTHSSDPSRSGSSTGSSTSSTAASSSTAPSAGGSGSGGGGGVLAPAGPWAPSIGSTAGVVPQNGRLQGRLQPSTSQSARDSSASLGESDSTGTQSESDISVLDYSSALNLSTRSSLNFCDFYIGLAMVTDIVLGLPKSDPPDEIWVIVQYSVLATFRYSTVATS